MIVNNNNLSFHLRKNSKTIIKILITKDYKITFFKDQIKHHRHGYRLEK